MNRKVVVLLGPPGSGKGTQASRLSADLGIPAISTGDILRAECKSGSELGRTVQEVLTSGKLVDDELMNKVVANRLSQCDCIPGCILDGYPRTVAQARYLDALLAKLNMPKPIVIDFTVSAEDVIARLCHRRQCPKCGKVFSIDDATLARGEVRCDQDGAKLAQRADDNPEAIRERLRLYSQNVANLVSYYRPGAYHLVRATRTPAEIAREVLALLNQEWSAHLAGVQVGATTQSMYRI